MGVDIIYQFYDLGINHKKIYIIRIRIRKNNPHPLIRIRLFFWRIIDNPHPHPNPQKTWRINIPAIFMGVEVHYFVRNVLKVSRSKS